MISYKVSDTARDMVDQPPRTVGTDSAPKVVRKVYCAPDSPLRLGDGTPLHLEWVIEETDGKLYRVPSELGGWFRRVHYSGQLNGMQLVSPERAETILWLTCADSDGTEPARVQGPTGYKVYGRFQGSSEAHFAHWAY
jgi:hypothetical protein